MSSGLIDTSSGVPPALENSPAVLPSDGTVGHRWAVVLAGGDGTRLQSLTLKIELASEIFQTHASTPYGNDKR